MSHRRVRGLPPGFVVVHVGDAEAVARSTLATPVREALRAGSLYGYAEHHPEAVVMRGRGMVYAVPLPDGGPRVVVRRSRHGGALARLMGERFLGDTRAPRELATSLHLQLLGIPTPRLVAYATYPDGPIFRRADVVTIEVTDANDLDAALVDAWTEEERQHLLDATIRLFELMHQGGVRHPDINLKNVLIARDENDDLEALLLDVDRVWFDAPESPRAVEANFRRFARSAKKRARLHGTPIHQGDLSRIAEALGVAHDGAER